MENSEISLEEQLRLARERAALELAQLRTVDERALTPRMLVRKAILLQLDDTPEGSPNEIEVALKTALERDDRCTEAYIELARYYYAVLDDSRRAKECFLKGLRVVCGLNQEIIRGLLECDEEIQPERDRGELQREYENMILGLFG